MCWQPCSLSLKAVLQMEDHNGQWISLTPLPMRHRVMKRWLTLDQMEGWKRPYVCTVGGFRPSGSLLLLSFYYLTIIVNNIVNYATEWQHIVLCSYRIPQPAKINKYNNVRNTIKTIQFFLLFLNVFLISFFKYLFMH